MSEIPGVGISLLVEEYPDPARPRPDLRLPRPAGPAGRRGDGPGRRPRGWVGGSAGISSWSSADLGWSLALPEGGPRSSPADLPALPGSAEGFEDDVLEGLDRGDLLARRFRHVAATALMVLRRPEGGAGQGRWPALGEPPGSIHWSKAACPEHPLLRETRARGTRRRSLDAPRRRWPGWRGGRRIRFRVPRRPVAVRGGLDRPGRSGGDAGSSRPAMRSEAAPRTAGAPMIDGPDGWRSGPRGGGGSTRSSGWRVIADVHLGYEWARAAGGDCLPSHSLAGDPGQARGAPGPGPDRLASSSPATWSNPPRPCRRTASDLRDLFEWLSDRGVEPDPPCWATTTPSGQAKAPPATLEVAGWTRGPRPPADRGPRRPSRAIITRSLRADGLTAPLLPGRAQDDRPARLHPQRRRPAGRLGGDARPLAVRQAPLRGRPGGRPVRLRPPARPRRDPPRRLIGQGRPARAEASRSRSSASL